MLTFPESGILITPRDEVIMQRLLRQGITATLESRPAYTLIQYSKVPTLDSSMAGTPRRFSNIPTPDNSMSDIRQHNQLPS